MTRIKWASEQDVAKEVLTELQRQGFETYEEVCTGYGGKRADIVGVRGPVCAVVECKTSLSMALLDQLLEWGGHANLIIGAAPMGRGSRAAEVLARSQGFGLWSVYVGEIRERVSPRLHRQTIDGHRSLRGSLCEAQRSGQYAKAGSRGCGYWTPFRQTVDKLVILVTMQPGIELKEALKQNGHHYATDRSAMSAIPMLIRQGVIEGIRSDVVGRRICLYPTTTLPIQ